MSKALTDEQLREWRRMCNENSPRTIGSRLMATDKLLDEVDRLRTALTSVALAGDDIKEMASAFVQTRDVSSLQNYGGNIASIARRALAGSDKGDG